MKQSRATSFLKSVVSTAVGFIVAFLANMIILPWFGLDISHGANFILTCIYTIISIARGYALERLYEAMGWRTRMSAFALAVLAERQRQITHEGYDHHHDNEHTPREIASAAAAYFYGSELLWPWKDGFKLSHGDLRRDLVRGCALGFAAGELSDRNRKRRASVIPQNDQQPQLSPESKSAA